MSGVVDEAAMAVRGYVAGINNISQWNDLDEESKNWYRGYVWAVLHALFLDTRYLTTHLRFDTTFVASTRVIDSDWGVERTGMTMAEAVVNALEEAKTLPRNRRDEEV